MSGEVEVLKKINYSHKDIRLRENLVICYRFCRATIER